MEFYLARSLSVAHGNLLLPSSVPFFGGSFPRAFHRGLFIPRAVGWGGRIPIRWFYLVVPPV